MAMSSDPSIEENQLGIRVRGDLGDFQIIEEETESEDDEDRNNSSRTTNALSTVPQDIVKPSVLPVYGSVRVSKSENVHFGNNTFFNGPVTIKQIVRNKEHDNPGYQHTEDDVGDCAAAPQKANDKADNQIRPLQLQLWLKLTFSGICIIIVGGICAVVSVTLINTSQEDIKTPNTSHEDDSTKCVKVEGGLFHNYQNLKFVLVSMSLVLLTYYVWCYKLLTKEVYVGDNAAISVSVKHSAVTKRRDKYNIEADPLLIAPTHLRIVSRTDWLAQPVEKPLDPIRLPVPWVIIQHTATESCHTQSECVLSVRLIQMFHVESRGWYDIGYNFLVAGDGSAYYGRGWDAQGAHTLGYNKYSMGIAFIGTFSNEPPPKKQLDACKKLIQKGVELGKIAKDYKLFAHRQLASTLSPGDKLFEILKEWPHFVKNFTDIVDLLPDY